MLFKNFFTKCSISFPFQVSSAEAKLALHINQWKVDEAVKYVASRVPRNSAPPIAALSGANTFVLCDVCVVAQHPSSFSYLSCRHYFCKGCWELHFECQILQGISTSKYYCLTITVWKKLKFSTATLRIFRETNFH